jgi:FemAB-related protein (PEP-CTERM system-associated)
MAWQRFISSSFGHEPMHLVARQAENREIVGLLPLFLVRSKIFGRLLVSTPQAAYGGVLADSGSVAELIVSRAQSLAREQDVQFLELRNFRNGLRQSSLTTKDLYVTFRQELADEPDKNLMAIPRKTRAEIREGIRNGLEFKANEIGVNQFFDVYARSVRNLGTPVLPRRLFAIGLREFRSDCRIFSVHWKGRVVAAVWTLFYKDEVLPYYGGSLREYNRLGVNNFMYWMLMKYSLENGYRIFDFGRSKKGTGSFSFKKRWGLTMMDLPYQYYLMRQRVLPDTSPLNPKFSLPIRVWRRLPLFITNSLGPLISKHLI